MREGGSGVGFLAGAAQGGGIVLLILGAAIYTFWEEILAISFLALAAWIIYRIVSAKEEG